MASTWVLKFPQVDLPKQPFLIHVTQKKGLDLDLLATDGEVAYRGKVRERNLTTLKAPNYDGADAQWSAILRYTLISKQDSGIDEAQRKNLETECAVSGKGSKAVLSITFRTRIEDITSRLGAIELAYSEDTDDVDLFGWASSIIDQRDELSASTAGNEAKVQTMQSTIDGLQKELAELLQAKEEHEDQMLSKFTILLNEKKEKIRNQQRLLENAKVDPQKLEQLQHAGEENRRRVTTNSKKRKGKSGKQQPDANDSDGFDVMDVDKAPPTEEAEIGSDAEVQDVATASESEDDHDLDSTTGAPLRSHTKATSDKEVSPPPPPRALPFQRKSEKGKAKEGVAPSKGNDVDDDEETASEDDEL